MKAKYNIDFSQSFFIFPNIVEVIFQQMARPESGDCCDNIPLSSNFFRIIKKLMMASPAREEESPAPHPARPLSPASLLIHYSDQMLLFSH